MFLVHYHIEIMVQLIVVNLHQVVRQMPTMASSKQPTIAVITAQYCEKLAVDSMLENKETFVRYTTVGKHSVFFPFYSPLLTKREHRLPLNIFVIALSGIC
jgi:hypothetical protein